MTTFALLAALLLAAALAALLPSLLMRRTAAPGEAAPAANAHIHAAQLAELDAELASGKISEDEWLSSGREIRRRVLEEAFRAPPERTDRSPRTALAAAVMLPLLAAALYAWLGTPAALTAATTAHAETQAVSRDQMLAMAARLAARLQSEPEDAGGWAMLARVYSVLGREPDAVAAYANAVRQRPDDGQLLADYADALAVASGGTLSGEPSRLIARALRAEPGNVKALALAGTAAFEQADYRRAADRWQDALRRLPASDPFAARIRDSIAEANALLGRRPAGTAPERSAAAGARKGPAAALRGVVRLSPELASRVRPDDTVFVYARAAQGPRMPLAVTRRRAGELPFDFSLDDSMAMTPALRLSGFAQVIVVARISATGSALPGKGDLEAATAPISSSSSGLELVIGRPGGG